MRRRGEMRRMEERKRTKWEERKGKAAYIGEYATSWCVWQGIRDPLARTTPIVWAHGIFS
jgi:hypothetical protein